MGVLGLWLIALAIVASVVAFVGVAIATKPRAVGIDRLTRVQRHEEIARLAVADLDREYRELLSH